MADRPNNGLPHRPGPPKSAWGQGTSNLAGSSTQNQRQPPPAAATRPANQADQKSSGNAGADDTVLNTISKSRNELSSLIRPGYGTQGAKVDLLTNYITLSLHDVKQLYVYSLTVEAIGQMSNPSHDNTTTEIEDQSGRVSRRDTQIPPKKRKRLIQLLLAEHLDSQDAGLATDYAGMLVCSRPITPNSEGYTVRYRDEEELRARTNAKEYHVSITENDPLDLNTLTRWLGGLVANPGPSPESFAQAFNLLLTRYPREAARMITIGQNTFYKWPETRTEESQAKTDLGYGLFILRGFFLSARMASSRVIINVQLKNTPFFKTGPLRDLFDIYIDANEQSVGKLKRLSTLIKGLSVKTRHVKDKATGQSVLSRKTIFGLASKEDGTDDATGRSVTVDFFGGGPPDVRFATNPEDDQVGNTGPGITVAEYFKKAYPQIKIDHTLPVVNVGSQKRPVYLPVDVCEIVKGQAFKSTLSGKQTDTMINQARLNPGQSVDEIVRTGLPHLGLNPPFDRTAYGKNGMSVGKQLLTVQSRVLQPPTLAYVKQVQATNGFWNLSDSKVSPKKSVKTWAFLQVWKRGDKVEWPSTKDFSQDVKSMVDAFRSVGLDLPYDPREGPPGRYLTIDVTRDLDEQIRAKTRELPSKPDLLLVFLGSDDAEIYKAVKRVADVALDVINVCMQQRKVRQHAISIRNGKPAGKQYFANVALKINLKLGGTNQTLAGNSIHPKFREDTMVVGLDVTHPQEGASEHVPSVAGIVASMDGQYVHWPAALWTIRGNQEIVTVLDEMFASRLELWKTWRSRVRRYPQRIIVYRDGTSEGQFQQVLEIELQAMNKACRRLYDHAQQLLPDITVIVAIKRHNTRFYRQVPPRGDKVNPKHGTVVDSGITMNDNWDFYMQSHAPIAGTARPTHYRVVHDEVFRKLFPPTPANPGAAANELERFTHSLCYLNSRATRAVSIVPPARFADLACDRARCYKTEFSNAAQGSATARVIRVPLEGLIKLPDTIRDTMFYI